MPTDAVLAEAVNFREVQEAFEATPSLAGRYIKQVMFRFSRRVARRTKKEYLSGPPGISGGPWARLSDRNVRGFTVGNDLAGLKAVTKASRILRTHIEGAVILPKQAGMLYLSRKTGVKGKGTVFARVRSVTIPARVPFEQLWREEIPRAGEEIHDAAHRAAHQALEQRMKVLGGLVNRVVNA